MLISESFVNVDRGYRFGESDPYTPHTEDLGQLFRSLQQEYGRCVGKVYIDREDGVGQAIGWVFAKRVQYEDCQDWYTREVWVTVYEEYAPQPPRVRYAAVGRSS